VRRRSVSEASINEKAGTAHITVGSLAADTVGEELLDIGDEDPDDTPTAPDLFDPATAARMILMQTSSR
jgi:hypothetical protein